MSCTRQLAGGSFLREEEPLGEKGCVRVTKWQHGILVRSEQRLPERQASQKTGQKRD